jgi:hypothetical protein
MFLTPEKTGLLRAEYWALNSFQRPRVAALLAGGCDHNRILACDCDAGNVSKG